MKTEFCHGLSPMCRPKFSLGLWFHFTYTRLFWINHCYQGEVNSQGTFPKMCFQWKFHEVLPMSFTRRLADYWETSILYRYIISHYSEEGNMGMWGQSLLKTENHSAITFLSLFFEVVQKEFTQARIIGCRGFFALDACKCTAVLSDQSKGNMEMVQSAGLWEIIKDPVLTTLGG